MKLLMFTYCTGTFIQEELKNKFDWLLKISFLR